MWECRWIINANVDSSDTRVDLSSVWSCLLRNGCLYLFITLSSCAAHCHRWTKQPLDQISQHMLSNKCLHIFGTASRLFVHSRIFFGKIGFPFVSHCCFYPCMWPSVLCPCYESERLTDWGGQMTIQVWAGANPSSGFAAQGRLWREGKGCCSISQRYKSQRQTSKTHELWSSDLRPCGVPTSLLFRGNCYAAVDTGVLCFV